MPIFIGSRITVREAISTYGLNTKAGLIEHAGARLMRSRTPAILTVSNTFRHKAGGAAADRPGAFGPGVYDGGGVQAAVVYTVKMSCSNLANVTMVFERFERSTGGRPDHEVPRRQGIESWGLPAAPGRTQAKAVTDDDDGMRCSACPLPTQMYGYKLLEGRWLLPDDTNAVVMTTKLAGDEGGNVGIGLPYGTPEERARVPGRGAVFDPI